MGVKRSSVLEAAQMRQLCLGGGGGGGGGGGFGGGGGGLIHWSGLARDAARDTA
eukprot:SAG31_NODE_22303_length_528_cov_9.102564_2_plen_53_part_01